MIRFLWALALLVACGAPRSERVTTTATKGLGVERCPAPPEGSPTKLEPRTSHSVATHLSRDPLDLGIEELSRFELNGCLAAGATVAEGERFPAPPLAARDSEPRVRVNRVGDQWILTHELSHPCCLRGRVEGKIEGSLLRFDEHLTGEACRCECSSTIRSSFRLGAAIKSLELRLIEHGRERVVYRTSAAELRKRFAN